MKSIILFFLVLASVSAFAGDSEMRQLIQATHGNMYAGSVPAGYRSVKLETIKIQGGLESFFFKTTKQKLKDWKEFVHTSGEYNHVSAAERRQIAADPLTTLETNALLEIEEVYAIYKGNKLIGYFVQVADYVQAAIYQDGAWYDLFLDAEMNVVEAIAQSA